MAKNLRKGSKVFVSTSGRGFKRTPGIVIRATKDFVDVKTSFGVLMRKPSEVKRRSK